MTKYIKYDGKEKCPQCKKARKWLMQDEKNGKSECYYRGVCYDCYTKNNGHPPKSLQQLNMERQTER